MNWIKACQALGILSVLVSAFPAYGERACVNEMLEGEYSFRISGQILSGPLAGLDNGVALVTFDGDGNFIAKDHVVLNGVQPANEWRQSTGVYSLNRACTGKAQVNFSDPRTPPIVYYFVLTDRGRQLDVVVGTPGANVSVVATKK